jgi:hypothetical protein
VFDEKSSRGESMLATSRKVQEGTNVRVRRYLQLIFGYDFVWLPKPASAPVPYTDGQPGPQSLLIAFLRTQEAAMCTPQCPAIIRRRFMHPYETDYATNVFWDALKTRLAPVLGDVETTLGHYWMDLFERCFSRADFLALAAARKTRGKGFDWFDPALEKHIPC